MNGLISRKEAIEWFLEWINNMPSVAERKTGEWIDADTFKVKCSVCDYCCDISAKFLYSFCPNCGTNMRGEL